MHKERISVCMASYNGEQYIEKQIESILAQLNEEDELIVIDDRSKDKTAGIISTFQDSRIRFFQNHSNQGVVKTFERAIKLAFNDYIFLADQDDLWTEQRIEKILEIFRKNPCMLVTGNLSAIDKNDKKINIYLGTLHAEDSCRYLKNIVGIFFGTAFYYGCAMGFRKELKEVILPIPKYIEAHDLWIAMAANLQKSNFHLEETVLYHRIHEKNVTTSHRKMIQKIYSRIIFAGALITLSKRVAKQRI